jgi:hypothetical protein
MLLSLAVIYRSTYFRIHLDGVTSGGEKSADQTPFVNTWIYNRARVPASLEIHQPA